jgi:hypothetical protein
MTYGLGDQLKFIQGWIPAVLVHLLLRLAGVIYIGQLSRTAITNLSPG